jgi:hypothetical protein
MVKINFHAASAQTSGLFALRIINSRAANADTRINTIRINQFAASVRSALR